MSSKHRKTCKRYDVPGDSHFLTFSCYRLPLFTDNRLCEFFIDSIKSCQAKEMFDLWAFVIMPEHVHMILLPIQETSISKILKSIKQFVATRGIAYLRDNAPETYSKLEVIQKDGKKSYRFWQQGGGYDRNLRSDREIHQKIKYVHNNPVKRELCRRTTGYRWSSATAWSTGVDEPLTIQRESVPRLTNLNEDVSSYLLDDRI